MHIEHILQQGSGERNEDYLIMDRGIYGVFDGATSLDGTCFEGGASGGALASSIAGETFLRNHHALVRLGADANESIRERMERCRVDVSRRCGLWSTSAAVVRLTDEGIEWFRTGDAQIVFVGRDGGFTVAGGRDDHDYPTLCMIRDRGRHHPAVHGLIETVRQGMNREYGVLNGEREAEDFFLSGLQPARDVGSVLLFTDGLDIPCETPRRRKDFSDLVDLACTLGLHGLRDHVRGLEAADPDIERYPRFKRHDDMAAIAIHF
jgi:hypothetical protein